MSEQPAAGLAQLSLRPAGAADVPALAALEQVCFTRPWSQAQLQATCRNPLARIWVALGPALDLRAARQPAAAATGSPPADRLLGYISWVQVLDTAEINNLAVAPACRRQGVGRRLLQLMQAQSTAAGALTARLEVAETNWAARELYRSCGFYEVGRRKGYYAGTDALLMDCRLDTENLPDLYKKY
ncbi:MAG: N-acetyltransferase [Oscillospiraceae bacterium]|nr:N-acetyltransferase [Oscillospiraceae bacterium]MDD4368315.1 N-acetyltransferase [Oscillospiraceae bacterium]